MNAPVRKGEEVDWRFMIGLLLALVTLVADAGASSLR